MKRKGVASLDSSPFCGSGISCDAKLGSKHQRLLQNYLELQKENVLIKNRLKVSKQKKMAVAAEVRFLTRRYKLLCKMKSVPSSKEQPSIFIKSNETMKQQSSSRKDTSRRKLPPIPAIKHKKNRTGEEKSNQKLMFDVGYDAYNRSSLTKNLNGRASVHKETLTRNRIPFLDLNPKKRIHAANDSFARNSIRIFDSNPNTLLKGKEIPLPSRTPVFDLNEISTEDEEIPTNIEEATANGDKQKISWLDPVALRV